MGIPYDPTKPAQNDRPSNDQAPMQSNFSSIKTLIDVDHLDFSNVDYGMHQWVQMPTPYSAGATVSVPRFFTNTVDGSGNSLPGSLAQFFLYNAGTAAQSSLQNNVTSTNGSVMLPMGIILKWGNQSFSGSQNPSVVFNHAFPNACFGVQLTLLNSNGTVPSAWRLTTVSTTGWTGNVQASGTTTLYWLAIGN